MRIVKTIEFFAYKNVSVSVTKHAPINFYETLKKILSEMWLPAEE